MRCIHCGAEARPQHYGGRPKCADVNGCLLRESLLVDLMGQRLGIRKWRITDRWFPTCSVIVKPGVRAN